MFNPKIKIQRKKFLLKFLVVVVFLSVFFLKQNPTQPSNSIALNVPVALGDICTTTATAIDDNTGCNGGFDPWGDGVHFTCTTCVSGGGGGGGGGGGPTTCDPSSTTSDLGCPVGYTGGHTQTFSYDNPPACTPKLVDNSNTCVLVAPLCPNGSTGSTDCPCDAGQHPEGGRCVDDQIDCTAQQYCDCFSTCGDSPSNPSGGSFTYSYTQYRDANNKPYCGTPVTLTHMQLGNCPLPDACPNGPDGTAKCPCPVGQNWDPVFSVCRVVVTLCWDGSSVPVGTSCPVQSQYCTIQVNATTNGSIQDPPGGFAYSISNAAGSSLTGGTSGSHTFYNVDAYSDYTISYQSSAYSFSGYSTAQTQYCDPNAALTYTLAFSEPAYPITVTAKNTAIDSSVVCATIAVSWSSAPGGGTFTVYRQTVDGSAPDVVVYSGTDLSFTDTPPSVDKSYQYRVQYSIGSASNGTSNTISPTRCIVNLGSSDKLITQVNGQNLPYTSSCVGNQGGAPRQFKAKDTLRMSINICNNGTISADKVSVIDNLANSNLTNIRNISFQGGSATSSSTSGNTTTFNFGSIPAGYKGIVSFDVDTVNPDITKQNQLYRFRNIGKILFTSSAPAAASGCISDHADLSQPCVVDTGYKIYINGKAPTTIEVNP
jgi:hypothetical protein